MKGRGRARSLPRGNAAADFLVCFPPRAHLALMPKPVYSPVRGATESSRRHQPKTVSASPLFRSKSRAPPGAVEIDEPTSPKVTCAGQVKIKSKQGGSCNKNWQSVIEEIEKIHGRKKAKKLGTSNSLSGLGFMHFMACLKGLRFNMRCFSPFPSGVGDSDSSVDEEEEEECEDGRESYDLHQNEDNGDEHHPGDHSRAVFSKWLMILQENQQKGAEKDEDEELGGGSCSEAASLPPKNALLLMRCRSAPSKSWLEEKQEEKLDEEAKISKQKLVLKEELKDEKENFILQNYAPDFLNMSTDIVKETWVVGRSDPFSRSRSWK